MCIIRYNECMHRIEFISLKSVLQGSGQTRMRMEDLDGMQVREIAKALAEGRQDSGRLVS